MLATLCLLIGGFAIRDGKLYVLLAQQKNDYTSHPGVYIAVVDLASHQVEQVIKDMRLSACGGEADLHL